MSDREQHWTHRLFIENADLYLPFLEDRSERGAEEAEVLDGVFRELNVPADGRVLDLACGMGRHSVPLAQRGYRVTGVDLSPRFIQRARERAMEAGTEVQFIVGDGLRIREHLAGADLFDAMISMFTSYGYHGREADVSMFRQLHGLAAPGATLVVNAANRDRLLPAFAPEGIQEAGNMLIIEYRSLDLETSSTENRWEFYEREGEDLRHRLRLEFSLRIYSLHEVIELLTEAGWHYSASHGMGRDGMLEPMTPSSNGTWVVATA